jgi:membrane dipeptidase
MVRSFQNPSAREDSSRRRFLKVAAGCVMASGLPACATQAADTAAQARARGSALLDTVLSVDMHSHAGGVLGRNAVARDIASPMKQGKLSALCLSLVSDSILLAHDSHKQYARREPQPGELHAYLSNRMDFADRLIADQKLARILTLADLRASQRQGVPGAILAVEGSDFLEGRVEHLQTAYDRGIRHWQLVHYRADNALGDIQTEHPLYGGATPFGLDVVRGCNQLGLVLDVAHATLQTVKQVAQVSTTPLVLSHTGFSKGVLKPETRWIGVDHARHVADTGGIVGIWANAHSFNTLADYANSLARLAEAIGIDHVGIGTDMEAMHPPTMTSYADWSELIGHLLTHFTAAEVAKIAGGNYLRIFDQVTRPKGGAAGSAT